MKTCTTCNQNKPLSDFYKSKATKDGHTPGCKKCYYKKDKIQADKKANPLKFMLYNAKHRAKRDGVPFTLTEFNIEMPTHCPITGVELLYAGTGKTKGYGAEDNAASIDKIDPTKGYTPENSVIISWKINRAKAYLSIEDIENMAKFYAQYKK